MVTRLKQLFEVRSLIFPLSTGGRTCTGMGFLPKAFKAFVYTIPPHPHVVIHYRVYAAIVYLLLWFVVTSGGQVS